MPSDITMVITDATRMTGIRKGLHVSGRALWFTESNLALALDSIRTHQPKLVAVDALFAQTPQGRAFVERIEKLTIPGSDIRLITHGQGGWATTPRAAQPLVVEAQTLAASAPTVSPAAVASPKAGANTRRAPRFRVLDPLKAVVEGGDASLVNISVLGAQVVSQPVLRPNQTIKVALSDTDEMLRVTAHVAWSVFEQPKPGAEAYYRAGMEFTDAAKQTLEEYCRRHCANNPLPSF